MISLAQMVEHLANRHHESGKAALIYEGESLTYRDVRAAMRAYIQVLSAHGVTKGSRVLALMGNRVEYPILFAALSALDASLSPANVRFVAPEVADAVDYIRPAIFVTDREHEGTARQALRTLPPKNRPRLLVLNGRNVAEHEDLTGQVAQADGVPPTGRSDPDACAYLAFTGGTTGVRKAAVIPAGNFYQTILWLAVHLRINSDDTTLTCGSFSHTMPFYYSIAQLYCGGTVVVLPRFAGRAVLDTIARHEITWFAAVPTMYHDILDVAADFPKTGLRSLRRYVSSGAPLLTATKNRLAQVLGPNLYEYYGATELGWVSTLEPRDQLRKTRCVGLPMPGTELKIVGDDHVHCGNGEVGTIFTRGNILMKEYFERPQETREVFDGDWATAGDVGYLDDEGYLHLVDRKKDLIVSGGINIYPVEIEEVLLGVPGLDEVACIGVPDARWGESVLAVCVIGNGVDSPAWEQEARRAVEKALSSFKRPTTYEFVDSLPRSHAGKVLKRVIREKYWQGQERRI
ncbi:MAG TPA: class I adenylate-forming enzyme family protein [Amycolatopsis sp.]|nr:class I adenylate-forming enzyme family protein [Amycolatopsis sp.]